MDEKREQKQQDMPLAKLEAVKCKYCSSIIPSDAILCPVCHLFSKWWRNQITIDRIGLLLTCLMIILAIFQTRAALNESIKASDASRQASDALRRSATTEKSVSEVQSKVKILNDAVAESKKQVDKLQIYQKAGKYSTEEIAKAFQQVRFLQDQLEIAKKRMEQIDKRIAEIPSITEKPILKYFESKFSRAESGLSGIISFKPSSNIQMNAIAFKIIILPGSNSIITSINPAAPISLMVSERISVDGKSAQISYTVVGSDNPGINITLSGSARLRIEGSPGIKSFEIEAK